MFWSMVKVTFEFMCVLGVLGLIVSCRAWPVRRRRYRVGGDAK
jgi:hypothetical protein